MRYACQHANPATASTDCLVIGVHAGKTLPAVASQLDRAIGGLLQRLLRQGDITGKVKQSQLIHAPSGIKARRLLVVGLGDPDKPLSTLEATRVASGIAGTLKSMPIRDAVILLDDLSVDGADEAWIAREMVRAVDELSYTFKEFKSRKTGTKGSKSPADEKKPTLARITLALAGRQPHAAELRAVSEAAAVASGRKLARDLGNLPPNVCHPVYLAGRAQALARENRKLRVTVLDEKRIRALGMGAFLSVAQGSEQPGRLIAIEYQGTRKDEAPYVFVGKGITFDTGGVSLKPGAGMDEMKYDMCGAAAVFGVMKAVTELKLPVNVVGVVAAAENMPSGRASRPGDIVTTMSGQTVEILNTDAEGRLVLCDALTWVARYKPRVVVDIATLTGACVVALGSHAHGLYTNHAPLGEALQRAGRESNDRAWPMPLWDDYQEQLDSPFADMANIGGPKAGSVTAACFLSRYAKDYHWAHLDIAGTAWHSHAPYKGATGRPVGMLVQYLLNESRR